jgi:hypothetical protein
MGFILAWRMKSAATDYFFKKSAIFALPLEKMHHSFRAPTV